jgi:polyisoprenoid-binding protein YceI
MTTRRIVAAFALATLAALPAAAATTWTIDKSHSNVDFNVRHLMALVRGHFADYEGTIVMDADPAKSSVEFTIQSKSIDTANEQRDTHLRSADFFEVEKHPTITFKSTAVKKTGDNAYEVTGPLTMRGVTKVIPLPVAFLGEAKDPWGNTKAGFSLSTVLNRKDFGINWNKALDQGGFILGDEVKVQIDLEVGVKK